MSARAGWRRVNRERPCTVCGKPDWCAITTDGAAALCQRVESGRRIGEAGWLHRLRDDDWRPPQRWVRVVSIRSRAAITCNFADLAVRYRNAVGSEQLHQFARSLGLSIENLSGLGVGWSVEHRAWTFPMTDATGGVLGIRLRRPDGFKFAVEGSKEGLFVPTNAAGKSALMICEGPTDTAALLDMGFGGAVGRPSCTGGIKLLVELVSARQRPDVAILADADQPGERGAQNLASSLLPYAPTVRIIRPPSGIKDVRAWLQAGGNHRDVRRAIDTAPIRRLAVQARTGGRK